MADLLIQLAPFLLVCGYSALVCWFMIVGCDKWWEPFLFAALAPFVYAYTHRITITFLFIVSATLYYVPIFLMRFFT